MSERVVFEAGANVVADLERASRSLRLATAFSAGGKYLAFLHLELDEFLRGDWE
jgi:hypothetical protein